MSQGVKKYDLIIFDCDGTLTHSDDAYYHAFCETLTKFGQPLLSHDIYHDRYSGKLIKDIILAYCADHQVQFEKDFEDYYWTLESDYLDRYTFVIDGADIAVQELQKTYKTCIASNNKVSLIKNALDQVGLRKFFADEVLFSSEHVKYPKPAPDVFIHAAERMGHVPENTIVIEDSTGGVQAAIAAGMTVIGFSGSASNPERKTAALQKAGADIVFADWKDILNHINVNL